MLAQLETRLPVGQACQLVEHTADVNLAEDWLRYLPTIEGVVAKRADRKYADRKYAASDMQIRNERLRW